jgi:hypothetical protein
MVHETADDEMREIAQGKVLKVHIPKKVPQGLGDTHGSFHWARLFHFLFTYPRRTFLSDEKSNNPGVQKYRQKKEQGYSAVYMKERKVDSIQPMGLNQFVFKEKQYADDRENENIY